MAKFKITTYVCDVCGKESAHRFKVKAKRLESMHILGTLRWVKIDICDDCYRRIVYECYNGKGGQNG